MCFFSMRVILSAYFQVRHDGQPVLGCARPKCFGWAENGEPLSRLDNFYTVNGNQDGFMRNDSMLAPFQFSATGHKAECQQTYQSTSCSQADQWVGGIAPQTNNVSS